MEKTDSKKMLLSVLGVAILVVAVVGISYAVFTFTKAGTASNEVTTGTISMSYTESETNYITIDNAMPITDESGKALTNYFDFTVSSTITGEATVNYEVRAKSVTPESPAVQLSADDVKMYLEKNDGAKYTAVKTEDKVSTFTINNSSSLTNPSVDTNTMLLYTGEFKNTTAAENTFADEFRLRMWLKSDAEVSTQAKTFIVKVDVYASVDKIKGQE